MRQRIVGIADLQVSTDCSETLVTYSLGSCIGIAIHDPTAKVGGILHYMLPDSSLDPSIAAGTPAMFADTGIPLLFQKACAMGLEKKRARVVVAGGAEVLDDSGYFDIGKRNYSILQNIFRRDSVAINGQEVGGNINRTIFLEIATGRMWLKASGQGNRDL